MKLEKPSALNHLEEMVDLADAVMLARGDLGVEIPPEDVPAVQKRVLRRVRNAGKPVIVATQMLESMIEAPAPTRAEASDVATAIYDGTDAVMLSAETATGKYPREAVEIMDRIAQRVEGDTSYERIINADHPGTRAEPSDAITTAAYHVARDIDAAAIVNFTTSGSTALRTARQRPDVPILCLTQNNPVAHRLTLSYGVHPVHVEGVENTGEALKVASKMAMEQGIADKGQRIVLTAGVPFNTPGSTNLLRIAWVE
jgi:pyruvate kinase